MFALKFNKLKKINQGIEANFYYQCLFLEILSVKFETQKKEKSKSCLLLLESPWWVRFLGGDFIIFRPKVKEILNLGDFH